MSDHLPPLHALAAFAEAARLNSFTKAAQELCVTSSAVGHRIRLLEQHYGVRLFIRDHNNVVLTDNGRLLLDSVLSALSILQASSLRLARRSKRRLRINVAHSFASNWLVERLEGFHQAHSDINLEIDLNWEQRALQARTLDRMAPLKSGDVDLAICYGGAPDFRGLESVKLMSVEMFPVCSPDYLAKMGSISVPKDLLRCTLLEMPREPWHAWFKAAGIKRGAPVRAPVLSNDYGLLVTAAVNGQGVALARGGLVKRHLTSGSLVRLLKLSVAAKKAYYALYVRQAMSSPEISAFLEWLTQACSDESR